MKLQPSRTERNHTARRSSNRCAVASPGARLSPLAGVVIALFGLSMLCAGLGSARVLTYHEMLFAQPAREMLGTGRWLLPTVAGSPSYHKPPLTHWSVAACMWLTGSRAEWVCRLPSVMAAVATALVIAAVAARWFGNRAGLTTGLVQLTMLYVWMQARLAEADMMLCAFVCAAMCAFAVGVVPDPRGELSGRWTRWAFFAATGLAFLTKGPVGPTMIFSAAAVYLLVNQDRGSVRFFFDPLGIALFALCTLAWPLAALAADPAIIDAWLFHNVSRFAGTLGGREPIAFYLYTIPWLILPWTPLAAYRIARGMRSGEYATSLWQLSACWVAVPLVVLTASAFKHKHYAIPLLPPLSIAAALGLLDVLRALRHRAPWRPAKVQLSAAVLVVTAGMATAALFLAHKTPGSVATLWGIVGLGLVSAIVVHQRHAIAGRLAVTFATLWLVSVGVQVMVMPAHDSYRNQTLLAGRINRAMPAGAPLYLVNLPENQITYYLRADVVRLDKPSAFKRRLRTMPEEPRYVLAPRHVVERLAGMSNVEELDRCATINRYMSERDRLTFVRIGPGNNHVADDSRARTADNRQR